MKSGRLSLLEPSGPVQAWNGIAFTFALLTAVRISWFKLWELNYDARNENTKLLDAHFT